MISSYSKAVCFGKRPLLIGERINPTGKSRFKQALRENDMDYILREGIAQQQAGAHILDVNVGLPEIDETAMMCRAVTELQSVVDLPLQIDTSNAETMEQAMRLYNGKPLINSVNGKQESMRSIFPLVKKYGGVVIALTLDESGIPETPEEGLLWQKDRRDSGHIRDSKAGHRCGRAGYDHQRRTGSGSGDVGSAAVDRKYFRRTHFAGGFQHIVWIAAAR